MVSGASAGDDELRRFAAVVFGRRGATSAPPTFSPDDARSSIAPPEGHGPPDRTDNFRVFVNGVFERARLEEL